MDLKKTTRHIYTKEEENLILSYIKKSRTHILGKKDFAYLAKRLNVPANSLTAKASRLRKIHNIKTGLSKADMAYIKQQITNNPYNITGVLKDISKAWDAPYDMLKNYYYRYVINSTPNKKPLFAFLARNSYLINRKNIVTKKQTAHIKRDKKTKWLNALLAPWKLATVRVK